MNHTEWETEICLIIAGTLQISYSDALGIIDTQSFIMSQSWARDDSSKQTADKILQEVAASSKPQPQPITNSKNDETMRLKINLSNMGPNVFYQFIYPLFARDFLFGSNYEEFAGKVFMQFTLTDEQCATMKNEWDTKEFLLAD